MGIADEAEDLVGPRARVCSGDRRQVRGMGGLKGLRQRDSLEVAGKL